MKPSCKFFDFGSFGFSSLYPDNWTFSNLTPRKREKCKHGVFTVLVVCSLFWGLPAYAGFLEMPDTTEVPKMERNSMLKDLDIPNVRERDPDPTSGPRLNITQFRVQGIVEYPELGITRESLSKLVEGIRFDLMGEGEMLDSGYTYDEVGEISDLIADIEEETVNEAVNSLDVQRLVFLIREQRQRRGVTVGMVENVADVITQYYRERGFILAKAYIPEQRVRDGVVTLTLLLGDLGGIKLLNNNKYKESMIQKIFSSSIGRPVTAKDIEERLFFVNDLPGLTAQAYFEPGSQVGDTRLNINVLEEKPFVGNVRLDNHGSESTGKKRLYTDGYWFNPSGIGDQLHIGLLGTFDPTDSLYGSIHYGLPVMGSRAKFTIGGSGNDFVSNSIGGLRLTGRSVVLDASLNYILKRSRVKNYAFESRLSQVTTEMESVVGFGDSKKPQEEGEFDDTVRNFDIVFNFDVLLEKVRAMHQGGVRLTYGQFVEGRSTFQSENPLLMSLNYSFIKFFKVPFTESNSRIEAKFSGQYTDDALPSISQFALSGPSRLRGFEMSYFNADSSAYLGVDWVFNGPSILDFKIGGEKFSDLLHPYLFVEGGYGDTKYPGLYNPLKDYDRDGAWAMMSDVGMGLKFSYKNKLRANVSYAYVTSNRKVFDQAGVDVIQGINHVGYRSNVYFDVQYSF